MGNAWGRERGDGDTDVETVLEALHVLGDDDPVALVLGRLEKRQGELAVALDGEALQVELVLGGGRERTHLLVFAPEGSVVRLRRDGTLAAGFRPHVTLRGSALDVVALVLGELDVARAVYRGVLELHVLPDELAPRFPAVMRVLAASLLEVADQRAERPIRRGHCTL